MDELKTTNKSQSLMLTNDLFYTIGAKQLKINYKIKNTLITKQLLESITLPPSLTWQGDHTTV